MKNIFLLLFSFSLFCLFGCGINDYNNIQYLGELKNHNKVIYNDIQLSDNAIYKSGYIHILSGWMIKIDPENDPKIKGKYECKICSIPANNDTSFFTIINGNRIVPYAIHGNFISDYINHENLDSYIEYNDGWEHLDVLFNETPIDGYNDIPYSDIQFEDPNGVLTGNNILYVSDLDNGYVYAFKTGYNIYYRYMGAQEGGGGPLSYFGLINLFYE